MQRWDTSEIAPEIWPKIIQAATQTIAACSVREVVTTHGLTTSGFEDLPEFERFEWVDLTVRVTELSDLAEERLLLGFTLGRDDWFWRGTAAGPFELLFCHEGDIHLETDDLALAQALTDAFALQAVALEPRKLSP